MDSAKSIIDYLNSYLDPQRIEDYCPNGFQVEGKNKVKKIITSVSASEELFLKASKLKADMIIVHHGILWGKKFPVIKGSFKKRLEILIKNNINLAAYHLPLDLHPEIGNNIIAVKKLGLKDISAFGLFKNTNIGYYGKKKPKIKKNILFNTIKKLYKSKPLIFPYGPNLIEKIGIISGGAQDHIYDALDKSLDAYITGEVSENIMHIAKEEKIHFISAGHYATERLGIKALTDHINEKFDVSADYVDVPVPV